jgi:hypothetical protein
MATQTAPTMGALGFAKELAAAGVSIVYANPGTSEMGILAGLDGISGKHSSQSTGQQGTLMLAAALIWHDAVPCWRMGCWLVGT